MSNPYTNIAGYRLWRRGVSNVEPHQLDPVVAARFQISRSDRVVTAGSCFAQHLSRRLTKLGFNYFVTERADHLSIEEREERGYGVFSARYGNIYTTRQLLQLFLEAFDERSPTERPWARPDGRLIDPYRPNIEPSGFASSEDVATSRREHIECVREAFTLSDVLIFTLGLTESWINVATGDVFPLAPGVVGGAYSSEEYAYINFDYNDVCTDLKTFFEKLKYANSGVRVLLTVSPVPLIATGEDRHVLVSTTYSKSLLRVAAEAVCRQFDWVDYFPSYEIIASHFNMGRYFEADLREVNKAGVDHVMRCFTGHYLHANDLEMELSVQANLDYTRKISSVVCDEESIATVNF